MNFKLYYKDFTGQFMILSNHSLTTIQIYY